MLEKFVHHRTLANLLMLSFIGMGLYALPNLKKESFPDFDASEVMITVIYRGASAEDVEQGICLLIEDAIDSVQNIKEVTSVAQEGSAAITIEIEDGADVAEALSDIEVEVDAITDFPAGAEDPIITQLNRSVEVLTVAVSGDMPAADLKDYCEDLKRRIRHLPISPLVEISGFSDRQLRIELDSDALRRLGLSASDIATTVGVQNLDLPVGMIETHDEDLLLRFVEERQHPQEIENIVVSGVPGKSEIRLRDIGRVVDTFADAEDKAWLDGQRAGILQIKKTKSQDTIKVAEQLYEFLDAERAHNPKLRLVVTSDTSELIVQRLSLLMTNAWQGMVLVFFTLWMFFNLRLSFWVVMSLPVSFMAAFFLMPMFGQTINMMSSVALLMAIGVLMDDGIVIGENVARHVAMGKDSMRAAIDGVSEVAGGVVSSFLTTVCVLGPLLFLEGDLGKVLCVIPIILIVTLGISLVEAFFILPAHLGHSLHGHDPNQANFVRRGVNRSVDWVRESLFGSLVDWSIRWRYLTIGATIGIFVLSIAMFTGGFVPFVGFPEIEGDEVDAKILLPQGTPLSETESIVRRINEAVRRTNDRFPDQPLVVDAGDAEPTSPPLVLSTVSTFNQNTDASESGPHVATVTTRILPPESRSTSLADFIAALREEVGVIPNAISVSLAESVRGPAGRPIEVRFLSDDLEHAKAASEMAQQWFARYEGVYDLTDDMRRGKQEIRLRLKPDTVALGLNVRAMATQLSAAYQGTKVTDMQIGNDLFEINVQYEKEHRDSVQEFADFQFMLAGGKQVPLQSLAEVDYQYGWSRIARTDGWRTVTLIGNTDSEVVNSSQLMSVFARDFLPELEEQLPDVDVSFGGQREASDETGSSMVYLFLLGLFGIYAILSYQFESWLEPLIVMFAIPMALIGVVFGHLLMGMSLSMPSLIGFISLAGIVVNDSILLVLFLKQARSEGVPTLEAASQASRLRFRAIVLTSATTMAGLLPLALEQSTQAQVLLPVAVSIVFGMLSSTVLILIVIPCLYVALHDFQTP
ncbi:efflux RND transporter permease subunit [Rhodopirellula sallentina]|uniref:Cation/multidrug efflux pump n=1 Tax=Rhodopirellula sallentina SM41 TaxID=1263870 RepID=M5TVN4_9BACT|nr:efflux RND transporter permease subunit [Rhodopirellula sallentina]EMI53220.1 cation/multidrug efflux pump [Rhodopirellula sallentina SM41]